METVAPTVRLQLERALGIATGGRNGLAAHPTEPYLYYPLDALIVVYNWKTHQQEALVNLAEPGFVRVASIPETRANQHAVGDYDGTSALAVSHNGQFLAVGESGHRPRIFVLSLKTMQPVTRLVGHGAAIQTLRFAPDDGLLLSIGNDMDRVVNVWKWRTQQAVFASRVKHRVTTADWRPGQQQGAFLATAGLRHLKLWHFGDQSLRGGAAGHSAKEAASVPRLTDPRYGSAARDLKSALFVDVTWDGPDVAYALTENGYLLLLDGNWALKKWVQLQVRAFSVVVTARAVFAACANGQVYLFERASLELLGSLPRPHSLLHSSHGGEGAAETFPDAIALCALGPNGACMAVVYSDSSLYLWDFTEYPRIRKARSHVFHADAIYSLCPAPASALDLSPGMFATASADHTVRLWGLQGVPAGFEDRCSSECAYLHAERSVPAARCICIDRQGRLVVLGHSHGIISVHRLPRFEQVARWTAVDEGDIVALDLGGSTFGNKSALFLAVATSHARSILVYDVGALQTAPPPLLDELSGHTGAVTALKWGGSTLVSVGADRTVQFFRANGTDAPTFSRHNAVINKISALDVDVCPRRNLAVAATADRCLHLYELESGKFLGSIRPQPAKGPSISPDGAPLLAAGAIVKVQLHPTEPWALVAAADRSIQLVNLDSGNSLASGFGLCGLVTGATFVFGDSALPSIVATSSSGAILVYSLIPGGAAASATLRPATAAANPVKARAWLDADQPQKLHIWSDPSLPHPHSNAPTPLTATAHQHGELALPAEHPEAPAGIQSMAAPSERAASRSDSVDCTAEASLSSFEVRAPVRSQSTQSLARSIDLVHSESVELLVLRDDDDDAPAPVQPAQQVQENPVEAPQVHERSRSLPKEAWRQRRQQADAEMLRIRRHLAAMETTNTTDSRPERSESTSKAAIDSHVSTLRSSLDFLVAERAAALDRLAAKADPGNQPTGVRDAELVQLIDAAFDHMRSLLP